MATFEIGQEIKPDNTVAVGQAPGQQDVSYGTVSQNAPATVIESRFINGQEYLNIDQTGIGGGTGWLLASDLQFGSSNNNNNQSSNNNQSNSNQNNNNQQQTTQQPTLDVNQLYTDSISSPEMKQTELDLQNVQSEITARQTAYAQAEAEVNDNPWYSEATRVGKLSKLEQKYNRDLQNLVSQQSIYENKILGYKADATTKVNMALKQYDINNAEYQNRLNEFNVLLQTGAIQNLGDSSLASLSQSTGFSMETLKSIQGKMNEKEVKPQLVSNEDANGNVTLTVVDLNTGKVISNQSLGNVGSGKSGGNDSVYTDSQLRGFKSDARTILADIDKSYTTEDDGNLKLNKYATKDGDKLVSIQEYEKAVNEVMNKSGIDFGTADDFLTQAMQEQGYNKWKW